VPLSQHCTSLSGVAPSPAYDALSLHDPLPITQRVSNHRSGIGALCYSLRRGD
jgi:hypothetical protein